MKKTTLAALAALALFGSTAIADDHKHPADKCPAGTHRVDRETKSSGGGGGNIGGNIGVIRGGLNGGGKRSVTERTTVCRDNKDAGIKDAGTKEKKK